MKNPGVILLIAVLLLCACLTGCKADPAKETERETAQNTDNFEIKVTDDIQKIIDRGYLSVGCKTDVPGFGQYDEATGTYEGMEIDLAYYVAAKIFGVGYSQAKTQDIVHFTPVTVENRFQVLESGEVDCLIATVTITEERAKKYAFSNCYHEDSIGIMMLSDRVDTSSLKNSSNSILQLDGKRIGVPSGATTREDFLQYTQLNHFSVQPIFMEFAGYEDLYQALKKGTIDAFAVDRSILQGYQDSNMVILPDKFARQSYGVCARKDQQSLTDVVNVVLKELDYLDIVW